MRQTVVLVDHPVGNRDDRASRMIVERGFEVAWYCPGKGDSLPEPGPGLAAAVVYGGTEGAYESASKPYIRHELDWISRWLAADKPYLGFCLGAQLLAGSLGARVARHADGLHEIGYVPIRPTGTDPAFMAAPLHVFHWHKDGFEVPPGGHLLAVGESFPNQAFRYGRRAYGLQFHPEVTPTVLGRWIESAPHMLSEPGAHAADRQRADAQRFDATLEAWFAGFLDRWLASA